MTLRFALVVAVGALALAGSPVLADHNCCEFDLPSGCASGPLVTAASCTAAGGAAFIADRECSPATGNCEVKTGSPPEHVCCTEDCVGNMTADPVRECFRALDIPTMSEWGLAVLALLTLTAATVVIMRRRHAAAV